MNVVLKLDSMILEKPQLTNFFCKYPVPKENKVVIPFFIKFTKETLVSQII